MEFYLKRSVTALLVGAMFVSCNEKEAVQTQLTGKAPETYTLTVEATKGDDTRALSLDGNTLNASWTAGDKVKVYVVAIVIGTTPQPLGTPAEIGSMTAQSSGESTTFTGEFQTSFQPGWRLLLEFNGSIGDDGSGIPGQDGTLETLANYYDIASATVDVTDVSGTTVFTSPAVFENHNAIVRFILKDKSGNTPVNVTQITVSYDTNTTTITAAAATDVFWVALPGFDNKTLHLTATDGNNEYEYERSGLSLESGRFYDAKVKLNEVPKPMTVTWASNPTFSTVELPSDITNVGLEINIPLKIKTFGIDVDSSSLSEPFAQLSSTPDYEYQPGHPFWMDLIYDDTLCDSFGGMGLGVPLKDDLLDKTYVSFPLSWLSFFLLNVNSGDAPPGSYHYFTLKVTDQEDNRLEQMITFVMPSD